MRYVLAASWPDYWWWLYRNPDLRGKATYLSRAGQLFGIHSINPDHIIRTPRFWRHPRVRELEMALCLRIMNHEERQK